MSAAEAIPAPFARTARREDAADIACIYNEGIEDRIATFETDLRGESDIIRWFDDERTIVVVERGGRVCAFASAFTYRPRNCYNGVREFSVYVTRELRRQGLGRIALEALIEACQSRGDWKLLSRVFPENKPSLNLLKELGFREVGIYTRHARLDGRWRDVVIVEKLIGEGAAA